MELKLQAGTKTILSKIVRSLSGNATVLRTSVEVLGNLQKETVGVTITIT
jgi:hypothetical protein